MRPLVPRVNLPQVAQAFDEELGIRGWNLVDLRLATGAGGRPPLDRGTVETAAKGQTWPRRATRARLETAVGWEIGWTTLLREGVPLRQLKSARGDAPPAQRALRHPASHTLAAATNEEIRAELLRRGSGANRT